MRTFSRADLGHPLAAALELATNGPEAARKLVPTNEGGLGLSLHLYESAAALPRTPIHIEHYDRLVPLGGKENGKDGDGAGGAKLGFAVTSGVDALAAASAGGASSSSATADADGAPPPPASPKALMVDAAAVSGEDVLPLGVFEWSVELWRAEDGTPITLENTLDECAPSLPARRPRACMHAMHAPFHSPFFHAAPISSHLLLRRACIRALSLPRPPPRRYRALPLRTALARGSAWGFFVMALPATNGSAPLTVRPLALNPAAKSTPELVVNGFRTRMPPRARERNPPARPPARHAALSCRARR